MLSERRLTGRLVLGALACILCVTVVMLFGQERSNSAFQDQGKCIATSQKGRDFNAEVDEAVLEKMATTHNPDGMSPLQREMSWKRLFQKRRDLMAGWVSRNPKVTWDIYEPEWICPVPERIGGFGDGGKWLCNIAEIHPPCLVYSFGSAGNDRFEREIRERLPECDIHIFDPTPGLLSSMTGKTRSYNATYHDVGISDKEGTKNIRQVDVRVTSLEQIMAELNHTGRRIDIFKIDVEGSEWETFKTLTAGCRMGEPSPFDIGQVQVELHISARYSNMDSVVRDFFDGMDRCGLRIFFKEPNILGCDGYKCIEYAFYRPSN